MQKETKEQRALRDKLDAQLDKELADTFPASDPTKITLGRPAEPVAPASDDDPRKNK